MRMLRAKVICAVDLSNEIARANVPGKYGQRAQPIDGPHLFARRSHLIEPNANQQAKVASMSQRAQGGKPTP